MPDSDFVLAKYWANKRAGARAKKDENEAATNADWRRRVECRWPAIRTRIITRTRRMESNPFGSGGQRNNLLRRCESLKAPLNHFESRINAKINTAIFINNEPPQLLVHATHSWIQPQKSRPHFLLGPKFRRSVSFRSSSPQRTQHHPRLPSAHYVTADRSHWFSTSNIIIRCTSVCRNYSSGNK